MTTMETVSNLAQVIVATSIIIVWVFRFNNIVSEFKQYGLPELVRSSVGAAKTVLATILVLDLWYEVPVISASLSMAFLMACAQGFHIRAKNPFMKFVPSALLLLLSLFVAGFHSGLIQMDYINLALILLSAISFIYYGLNSLFSKRMISEYYRWGYQNQRLILCSCQISGGLGLIIGLAFPLMLSLASFLLMCMMIVAVLLRKKLKDRLVQKLPALFYALLNLFIFIASVVQPEVSQCSYLGLLTNNVSK